MQSAFESPIIFVNAWWCRNRITSAQLKAAMIPEIERRFAKLGQKGAPEYLWRSAEKVARLTQEQQAEYLDLTRSARNNLAVFALAALYLGAGVYGEKAGYHLVDVPYNLDALAAAVAALGSFGFGFVKSVISDGMVNNPPAPGVDEPS